MVATTHNDPMVASAITKAMINMGKRAFKHGDTPADWWDVNMLRGWHTAVSSTFNAINAEDPAAAMEFAASVPQIETDLDSVLKALED